MANTHDMCLEREVLDEYCFDIIGFIYRNYDYPNIARPNAIDAYYKEVWDIQRSLLSQKSIEGLLEFDERLQNIYREVRSLTPQPHH